MYLCSNNFHAINVYNAKVVFARRQSDQVLLQLKDSQLRTKEHRFPVQEWVWFDVLIQSRRNNSLSGKTIIRSRVLRVLFWHVTLKRENCTPVASYMTDEILVNRFIIGLFFHLILANGNFFWRLPVASFVQMSFAQL